MGYKLCIISGYRSIDMLLYNSLKAWRQFFSMIPKATPHKARLTSDANLRGYSVLHL
ncbi:MAG: hypothetical protein VZR27_04160 [Acutalibacteraceae bacterium]|nr:hypothetical protein [Acutalibacteraceae bacterium]